MSEPQNPVPVMAKIGEVRSFPSPEGRRYFGVMTGPAGGASFDARETVALAEVDIRNCYAGTPTPYVKHSVITWPRTWHGRLVKRVQWWWLNRGRV